MKKILVILAVFLYVIPSYADPSYADKETRGLGIYYRSVPTNLVVDYNPISTSINMITVDFFSYDLTPRKFIGGIQFNYGVQDSLVEIVGLDMYAGKKITVIPYLFDVQFKVGPSFTHVNFDLDNRQVWSNHIGAFGAVAAQFSMFTGTSFFAEYEIRGVSPASMRSLNIDGDYKLEFDNSVPRFVKSLKTSPPIIRQGIRLGVRMYLTTGEL